MSWWQYALIGIGVMAVSGLASLYIGMAINDSGTDDRDDTKPANLWQGHERRKVRAGTTTPR